VTLLQRVMGLWSAFLGASAGAAAILVARHAAKRRILVVESAEDELTLYAGGAPSQKLLGRIALSAPDAGPEAQSILKSLRGSHATVSLDPRRFVFRTLELPQRATEFLGAIVRAQIDRLTPWQPDQAAFGWSRPAPHADGDRISLTVAATDKSLIARLLRVVQQAGAGIVVARVAVPNATGTEPDIVVAETAAAAFDVAFWRRLLAWLSLLALALAVSSSIYAWVTVASLDRKHDRFARMTAATRALIAQRASASDPAAAARQMLEHRKSDGPFVTLVIEALSRILPDDTFVTQLQIEGAQLRLMGLTADAPTLIRLIEKSDLFTNANFFAPTTRLPEEPRDRFNIEATIRPHVWVGP
jgi:general secretion pathway protein L